MAERLADRAVAVRAYHQLVAGPQLQRAEHRGHALGNVAYPCRAGRVDAEEPGRAFPGRRHQARQIDAVEAVRIALGAVAPGGGGLAHDDRRDTERAVVEVEDVRVEAERLQQGSIHAGDSASAPAPDPEPGPACYSDFSQSTRSRLTSSARSCWTQ